MRATAVLVLIAACGRRDPAADDPNDTDAADTDAADTDGADTEPPCDASAPDVELPDPHAEVTLRHVVVPPSMIDPESDAYAASHHDVWVPNDPDVPLRDTIFVMLPGTSNHGTAFGRLAQVAARAGFPTLVLAYDSEQNHAQLCAELRDLDEAEACRTAVIEEKVTGADVSDRIALDDADGVEGRLARALAFANQQAAGFDAGAYLDDEGAPRWDKVVLGGFSQGAAIAGWVGKEHGLARLVLFAGGCDAFETGDGGIVLAGWCTEARATPAERTFALSHLRDEAGEDLAIHEAFGLDAFGGYADADTESPSYCGGTHRLTTNAPSAGGGTKFHLSVAHDEYIPVDADDVPVLAEDHLWLLGAAGR